MTLGTVVVSILWMPFIFAPPTPAEVIAGPAEVLTVNITGSGYEPGTVVVRPGDVVRFVQRDGWAHNIEFHRAPEGAGFAAEYVPPAGDIEVLRSVSPTARVGPMLIGVGRVYEIQIGPDMPPGEYQFGCSHHSKWRGRLIVAEPEP